MKDLFYGICAGILIGIGGAVFLASENRVIGAILFSVALICICAKGYSLYTGKVGYLAFSHRASDFKTLPFAFSEILSVHLRPETPSVFRKVRFMKKRLSYAKQSLPKAYRPHSYVPCSAAF